MLGRLLIEETDTNETCCTGPHLGRAAQTDPNSKETATNALAFSAHEID